jgi:hypothetical protein
MRGRRRPSPAAAAAQGAVGICLLRHGPQALRLAGADTRDVSGVCARRGCISTTTEAGVPEAII